jgi:hypothetical protein
MNPSSILSLYIITQVFVKHYIMSSKLTVESVDDILVYLGLLCNLFELECHFPFTTPFDHSCSTCFYCKTTHCCFSFLNAQQRASLNVLYCSVALFLFYCDQDSSDNLIILVLPYIALTLGYLLLDPLNHRHIKGKVMK